MAARHAMLYPPGLTTVSKRFYGFYATAHVLLVMVQLVALRHFCSSRIPKSLFSPTPTTKKTLFLKFHNKFNNTLNVYSASFDDSLCLL